jgi:release factor glutamine methyltransferase
VEATDISEDALAIARLNATRHGARVTFRHGAILAGAPPPLDAIVSNPPYVARSEYNGLQPEVRRFEPGAALVGGDDGLEVVRQVVTAAGSALKPGGLVLIEIGFGQAEAAARIVADAKHVTLLRIRNDLQGIPRTVVASRDPV